MRGLIATLLALQVAGCLAGTQRYEPISNDEKAVLQLMISRERVPQPVFENALDRVNWLSDMSARLERRIPDHETRINFLKTLHYAASYARLDPQVVLAVIQVESNFRKYAVSTAGARGYMQVMPFWVKEIGSLNDNLFRMSTNLHYGCAILRHYLDIEKGDLSRALGRYNGSLGKSEYPNLVFGALSRSWLYTGTGSTPSSKRP